MSGELIFERLSERVARYSAPGGAGALRFQVVGYTSAELRGPAGVLFELENRSSDDGLEIEPGPAAGSAIGTTKTSGALDECLAVWLGDRVDELRVPHFSLVGARHASPSSPRR